MSPIELVLLFLGALAAGSINGAIGSGSLVTLPILIALGVDPATAIATNTIAMVSSAFGGTLANRTQLMSERRMLRRPVLIAVVGGLLGSLLLLFTSPDAIGIVVPILIVFALLLVVFQPLIKRWVSKPVEQDPRGPYASVALRWGVLGSSIYGGYFAAAQGVLLLGILGATTGRPIREINGAKNLLTLTVNITAALAFTVAFFLGHTDIVWIAVLVMAAGALLGGFGGAQLARRLPDLVLRLAVVVIAVASLTSALL
ncbi:MAG: sulfite exporter TauE/SafE family protein [Microbacteriaceae bacterium]